MDTAPWALRSICAIMTFHAHTLRWPHDPDTSSVTSSRNAKKLQRKYLSAPSTMLLTPKSFIIRDSSASLYFSTAATAKQAQCGNFRELPVDLLRHPCREVAL